MEQGLDGTGVDAVLGFLDKVNALELKQVRRNGQRQETQRPVGSHPGRHREALTVLQHEVTMPVLRTLDCLDVLEIREGGLQVGDPLPEAVGKALT